ncbi:MAG: aldolase/citrate lyase family protein [Litoreibacter sp.]
MTAGSGLLNLMETAMDYCCLFTPCLRLDALARKQAFGCGMVVLDLEDAIHISEKSAARTRLAEYDFSHLRHLDLLLGLRINPISTIEGIKDLNLLEKLYRRGNFPIDLINVPKVNGPGDLHIYRQLFSAIKPDIQIMPLIETIAAIDTIDEIAALSDMLLYGQADLSAEMYTPNRHFLDHARARICIAAARNGIPAIDTNSFEIKDMDILKTECEISHEAGFMAKAVIHPSQVDVIRNVFSIPDSTRETLLETITNYESTSCGFNIRGDKVVAPPFVLHARRILSFLDRQDAGHTAPRVTKAAE